MRPPHLRHLPAALGNGSDGAIHITTNTEMAQSEYNLTALIIDADCTWAPNKPATRGSSTEANDYIPIVTIRCLTPIVLNGTIDMSWLTRRFGYTAASPLSGGPASFGYNAAPIAYNISGGGCGYDPGGDVMIWEGSNNTLIGYNDDYVAIDAVDEWEVAYPPNSFLEKWIGPNRPFRYGLGGIGLQGHTDNTSIYGGKGGGHIEIYAPDFIPHNNPQVVAKGESGMDAEFQDNPGYGSGGGGGGVVLIFTMAAPGVMVDDEVSPGGGGLGDNGGGLGSGVTGGQGMYGLKDWRRVLC